MAQSNWGELALDAEKQAHAKDVSALRLELEHAKAQVKRLEQTKRAKIIAAKPARRRDSGDIVRVIVPDTHGAKVSHDAISAMLADIGGLDPQEIILLGDHVDCGGHLAQHHVMGYVAETSYSYEDDLTAAHALLDSIRKSAPSAKIEYIEGNHERRVETWCVTQTLRHKKDAEGLRKLYAPEFRLELEERGIPYFRQGEFYDGLPIPGVIRRGKCYFFHGISTGRNAVARTVDQLAANCVFGHTHRAQSELTRKIGSGVIGSWNPGCLCELQPLWMHTAPTSWTHGYAVQLVTQDGDFLHLNIPIIGGKSFFSSLVNL